MFMKHKPSPMLLGGLVAGLLYIAGAGCSSGQRADGGESVSNTQAAITVAPPGGGLAGNSNYWITAADPTASTGLPITGLNISIAVTQDLHIPNGMSIQLNGWSAPDSNIVWQQYGFSVTPPSLGWGIENWPTSAYGALLGLPSGGSLNFPGSLEPSLPTVPYGSGILPAGYTLDIVFQEDANGNIPGTTYIVTDLCGNTSSIGPVEIVGTSLAPSGGQGTIPESALAPIYGLQLNLVNMPGSTFIFSSGAGTITYIANEPLYVSNSQPSWTAAQGIVTGENSDIAYSELSSTPSSTIVQQFGLAQCLCDTSSGSSCVVPSGSYLGSCTGCTAEPSGSGCVLTCTSCGEINGTQNPNPSLQLPCAGSLTNGSISNSNGTLQLQCSFVPSADAGTNIDGGCGSTCVTPGGSYLGSCTGCAAEVSGPGCVLTCTSCTEINGSQNPNPSLTLPCTGTIENDNGALQCLGGTSSDAGGGSTDGGPSNDQDGSISEEDASSGVRDAESSDDATNGGGSSGGGSSSGGSGGSGPGSSPSGCGCSLSALHTASPTQSFAALAIAALISFGRRRKRGGRRGAKTPAGPVVSRSRRKGGPFSSGGAFAPR